VSIEIAAVYLYCKLNHPRGNAGVPIVFLGTEAVQKGVAVIGDIELNGTNLFAVNVSNDVVFNLKTDSSLLFVGECAVCSVGHE
jgi:hypothetical protein